jgi:hypothetical protein
MTETTTRSAYARKTGPGNWIPVILTHQGNGRNTETHVPGVYETRTEALLRAQAEV